MEGLLAEANCLPSVINEIEEQQHAHCWCEKEAMAAPTQAADPASAASSRASAEDEDEGLATDLESRGLRAVEDCL